MDWEELGEIEKVYVNKCHQLGFRIFQEQTNSFFLGENRAAYWKNSFLGPPKVGEKQCIEKKSWRKKKVSVNNGQLRLQPQPRVTRKPPAPIYRGWEVLNLESGVAQLSITNIQQQGTQHVTVAGYVKNLTN